MVYEGSGRTIQLSIHESSGLRSSLRIEWESSRTPARPFCERETYFEYGARREQGSPGAQAMRWNAGLLMVVIGSGGLRLDPTPRNT